MEANSNAAKLILLAILKEIPAISPGELQQLAQETLFFDYFTVANALSTLEDQKLVTVVQAKNETRRDLAGKLRQSCYLTPAGEIVLAQLADQISLPIQKQIRNLAGQKETRDAVKGYYYPNGRGNYDLFLEIKERGQILAALYLELPDEQRARDFCRNWPQKAAGIYRYILEELSPNED